MSTLSLVMIVRNEERYIERSLSSIQPLVNEIVVIDTGSDDATKQIAESLGAKVYNFLWIDDFSAARNYGIEQSNSQWIITMDADEYFDQDYSVHLKEFILGEEKIGRINIKSRFMLNRQESTSQTSISRIFPRYVRYCGAIHEQLESDLPRIDSGLTMLHDGYFESNKFERNIRLLLIELEKYPRAPYLLFQLAKEYRGLKETHTAEHYYSAGYALILQRPDYVMEAIVGYLYILLENRNLEQALQIIEVEKNRQIQFVPDFHFVSALIYMEAALLNPTEATTFLPLIEQAYLTCLYLGEQAAKEIVIGTSTYTASYNLGVFYEMTVRKDLAIEFYTKSASYQYGPAMERLRNL